MRKPTSKYQYHITHNTVCHVFSSVFYLNSDQMIKCPKPWGLHFAASHYYTNSLGISVIVTLGGSGMGLEQLQLHFGIENKVWH